MIGSGVAGLTFALDAARTSSVLVVMKGGRTDSNSSYAQGGIAAVWDASDTLDSHVADTLDAGAGLCRREAVERTVRDGPRAVTALIERGVRFTRRADAPEHYDLHHEGGHSVRRILHADDLTGAEMVRALWEAVAASPNIEVLDQQMAVDLVTDASLARRRSALPPPRDHVRGAYLLDGRTGAVSPVSARAVVLATGGSGKVYRYTTNPHVATGDGVAMAWRAGAHIANMEFVQFHPTTLFHPVATSFLLTEALRGEGGRLRLPDGRTFMERYDSRGDLAPRDIVARAIDAEIKRGGLDSVFLDMTHLSRATLASHFPNIVARLDGLGLDMATQPIPVIPAAHYQCGGVATDLHGESTIRGLFAIGEVACTGLHGANRLASNSLLEAIVFGQAAAARLAKRSTDTGPLTELPDWDVGRAVDNDELVVIRHAWEEIRRAMGNYVGIVRTVRRLQRAERRVQLVAAEVRDVYWDYRLTQDLVELRNLVDVAGLIVRSALRRRESRGLHALADFPDTDPRFLADTVLCRSFDGWS